MQSFVFQREIIKGQRCQLNHEMNFLNNFIALRHLNLMKLMLKEIRIINHLYTKVRT